MKRIKLNLAFFAVLLGLTSAFAFKPVSVSSHRANQNWQYNTGSETAGSSYSSTSGEACDGQANVCQIVAPADPSNPGHPIISSGLASRISSRDTNLGDVKLKD